MVNASGVLYLQDGVSCQSHPFRLTGSATPIYISPTLEVQISNVVNVFDGDQIERDNKRVT